VTASDAILVTAATRRCRVAVLLGKGCDGTDQENGEHCCELFHSLSSLLSMLPLVAETASDVDSMHLV
jgi:hypothetical protein